MEGIIPGLSVLWNDVIHTSPFHPKLLYDAQLEVGLVPFSKDQYFEIPVSRIAHLPIMIYMYENVKNELPICLKETSSLRGIQLLHDTTGTIHEFSVRCTMVHILSRNLYDTSTKIVIFHHCNVTCKTFQMPLGSNDYFWDASQYIPFSRDSLQEVQKLGVSAATSEYYQLCASVGGLPMTFFHVPHILIHGSVDIHGLRLVNCFDT